MYLTCFVYFIFGMFMICNGTYAEGAKFLSYILSVIYINYSLHPVFSSPVYLLSQKTIYNTFLLSFFLFFRLGPIIDTIALINHFSLLYATIIEHYHRYLNVSRPSSIYSINHNINSLLTWKLQIITPSPLKVVSVLSSTLNIKFVSSTFEKRFEYKRRRSPFSLASLMGSNSSPKSF